VNWVLVVYDVQVVENSRNWTSMYILMCSLGVTMFLVFYLFLNRGRKGRKFLKNIVRR
jgi:hypothetical protein